MTDFETVLARIERDKYLKPVKAKMLDMRRCLAGDFSRLEYDGYGQGHPAVPDDEKEADKGEFASIRWLLNTSFTAGLSNDLLKNVKTLVAQAGLKVPEIEFENAHPKETALMSSYLGQIFGRKPRGCAAQHHMRLALIRYLTDGMGWVWNGMSRRGVPCLRDVDTLDVTWEPTTPLLTDITWVSVKERQPAGYFADIYGESKFAQLHDANGGTAWREKRIEVEHYYDADDDSGNYYCIWRAGEIRRKGQPQILEKADSPHYSELDGWRQYFLPLEAMYWMLLPSTLAPVSIVEAMLPHEISARIFERFMQTVALRGVPKVFTREGDLTEDGREALESGDPMALVELEAQGQMPERWETMGVPREMFEIWQQQKQAVQMMAGVSPYAQSGKLEGVEFAAEVNAIRETAGLMAASVAIDASDHWERCARACLFNARMDGVRRRVNLDGTPVWFGEGTDNGPIFPFFELDADLVVGEDNLAYASRGERMQFYSGLLSLASEQTVMSFAPKSAQVWYRKLLQASGQKDVAQHFEPLQVAPQGAETEAAAATG